MIKKHYFWFKHISRYLFICGSRDRHALAILEFCLAQSSACTVINFRTIDTYFIEIMTALPKI